MSYTTLCTFTAYEIGESTVLPFSYVKRAKELGYETLGIVGSNLHAYPSFADACAKENIKAVEHVIIKRVKLRDNPVSSLSFHQE